MAPTYSTKKMRLWNGRRFTYTTSGHRRKNSEQTSFDVVVVYDKSKGTRTLFATNLSCKGETVLRLFKNRWGIETSYRMSNQFLIKTTSRELCCSVVLLSLCMSCLQCVDYVQMTIKSVLHPNDHESVEVIQMKLYLIGLIMNGSLDRRGKRS